MVTDAEVLEKLTQLHDTYRLSGRRVLVIIPDNTRSAPIGLFFRLLQQVSGESVSRLDYLVALGTHPFLSQSDKLRRVGITQEEKERLYPDAKIFNHHWDRSDTFTKIGAIEAAQMEKLTDGMLNESSEVWVNKMVRNYDRLLVVGPVFPHEIAGFSGSGKYIFPGICGPDFIGATHWLGALQTNMNTIGIRDTAVRRLIDRATEMMPVPITWLNLVVDEHGLQGLFIGEDRAQWEKAVELSARVNIRYVEKAFKRVLSIPSKRYDDFWTGAKSFYKLEPAVADGGELIVYAPQIQRISFTHDEVLHHIGFHLKDYYVANMERYREFNRTALAYSCLVKGSGTYIAGRELPRVQVTLATNVPREVCERMNIGYKDPRDIIPEDWETGTDGGTAVIRNAGEILYRVRED